MYWLEIKITATGIGRTTLQNKVRLKVLPEQLR